MGRGRAEELPQPSPSLSQDSLWEEERSIREKRDAGTPRQLRVARSLGVSRRAVPEGRPRAVRDCGLWALSGTLTTSIWLVLGVQRVSIRLNWKTVIMAKETNQETLKIMNITEKLCK